MTSCCISFDSYIKPQPRGINISTFCVVYLLIPTSNHNLIINIISLFLLYIFWFLHQTTTTTLFVSTERSCISFDSYIKPQRLKLRFDFVAVVYLLIPTSNHNPSAPRLIDSLVVYLLIPTSNHNYTEEDYESFKLYIFWFLHQTTTLHGHELLVLELYIFWFLHQTTTWLLRLCLGIMLYIFWFLHQTTTTALSVLKIIRLYIFWFLHQTTTSLA